MKKIAALIIVLSICLPLFNQALIPAVQANGEYLQQKKAEYKYLKEPLPPTIDHSIRGCDIRHGHILKFIAGNLDNLLIFALTDIGISFLAHLPVIGGAFQPAAQISDFVLHRWLSAILWGGTATLGLYLGAMLLEAGISLNAHQIISPQNHIMKTGFSIMLGFTHIIFVVILIIIAFLTILRVAEGAGWDIIATLPRLIAAILLINFSLLFANAILNISDNLIQGFLGEGRCPGAVFYNEFNIFKLDGVIGRTLWESTGKGVIGYFLTLFSLFFATFLTIIIALTVFTLFLFFIARYIAITILLIFMPIAWIGFVIPKVKIPGIGNLWASWWEQFLRWVIFGPLIAFFLYLSLVFIAGFQQIGNQFPGGFGMILQLIIVIIISLGGLFAANKMGAAGSSLILAGASVGLGYVAARTQGLGQFVGQRFLNAEIALMRRPGAIPQGTARALGEIGRHMQMPQIFPTTKEITDEIKKYTGIKLPTSPEVKITARITPRNITVGNTATLTWQSSGATGVTLDINPNPNPPLQPLNIRLALSGSRNLTPATPNTYTCILTATNPFGRATIRVLLLVHP